MQNEVIITPYFERDYKRLSKKFSSLENDLEKLVNALIEKPHSGEPLGGGIYKIRLAIKSKGGGKSGGFRVITCLINQTNDATEIYLITLYDKSETSTITKSNLIKLVNKLLSNTR